MLAKIWKWFEAEPNRGRAALIVAVMALAVPVLLEFARHPPAEAQISNVQSGCNIFIGKGAGRGANVVNNCPPPVIPQDINNPYIKGLLTLGAKESALLGTQNYLFVVREFKIIPTVGEMVNVVVNGLPRDLRLGDDTGVPIYNSECRITLARIDMTRKKASFSTDCERKS